MPANQNNGMVVGRNIRKIRKRRGLTQKRLGELCGMNEANVRKYELGKQNPKIETIERIAKALLCSADDLRGIKAIQGDSTEITEETTNEKYIESIKDCMFLLNAEGKEEAVKRVRELTEVKAYARQNRHGRTCNNKYGAFAE